MGLQSKGLSIKSIQRGTITIGGSSQSSNTATIAAVNTAKSVVIWGGQRMYSASDADKRAHIVLTNSTTVTATRQATDTSQTIVSYQVVEFN